MSGSDSQYRFCYETHLHTREGSACAPNTAAEMVEVYIAAGYAGMVVTDHFFNGNCAVPSSLPWAERIELFCAGYENACAAVCGRRFSVFFGWEYNSQGTEFLTYGLGKDFLLAHPDLHKWEITAYLDKVRQAGGLVSHAHPFRQREYIKEVRLFPEHVDAVEVFNAADDPSWNEQAAQYASENNLAFTAGSDKHIVLTPPVSGVACDHELASSDDFVTAVRSRNLRVIIPGPAS